MTGSNRPSRRQTTALADQLFETPYRFEFFQAVRLLEAMAREQAEKEDSQERASVGGDAHPDREVVRFKSLQSHAFPASTVVELNWDETTSARKLPPEMTVSFMGLTGPNGALPHHYTTLLIGLKDSPLGDFFDLFNHRIISLFYRAWEKYRFPIGYERAVRAHEQAVRAEPHLDFDPDRFTDPFTRVLLSLVGLGTAQSRRQLAVKDEALLVYTGHLAHAPRSAVSLERMLTDDLGQPIEIRQFQGQWLYLPTEEQSAMPNRANALGQNCALGVSTIAGSRVWSVESRFRVRLGPLGYKAFASFFPGGIALRRLCQVVRLYAGLEYDFDVQPVLRKAEIPPLCLGGSETEGSRLGWNTWLPQPARRQDADEAVFQDLDNGHPRENSVAAA
jgi:type VI secretion system protein ImpH